MKKLLFILTLGMGLYACSGGGEDEAQNEDDIFAAAESKIKTEEYDPKRGLGKWDHVELGEQLNVTMAKEGKVISDLKCASCHKYTDERLVGPGWQGVTEKHRTEWIMNFITDPDPMIDRDPELQAQLEICLVRMPDQNLSDEEARSILEFMRQNDGVQ